MMDSRLATITVPQISSGQVAVTGGVNAIVQASKTALRVLVRNLSNGPSVFLSFDGSTLQQTTVPSGNSYELPSGMADAFVLSPGQKLYACSPSANTRVSIALSEALPIDKQP
jgi:hypothetical protein